MRTPIITVALSLALCAWHAYAQSKQVTCGGLGSASSLGKVTVTIPLKSQDIQGKTHQMGTSVVGRVGNMLFLVTWDATEPALSVTRQDPDGFEAAAISSGCDFVLLRAKRPNEAEAQIGCYPH